MVEQSMEGLNPSVGHLVYASLDLIPTDGFHPGSDTPSVLYKMCLRVSALFPGSVYVWQQVILSDVRLETRPQDSLVAKEDV